MIATGKAARAARVLRRHFAGDAERDQRRDGCEPASVSTARAALTRAEPAQPMAVTARISAMAVGDGDTARSVGDDVGVAGERHDRAAGGGEARRRVAAASPPDSGRELGGVEPHRRRARGASSPRANCARPASAR